MTLWQSFLTALQALRLNRMRSLLTTLGIIIGIASVITMAAISNGAQKAIEDQINQLGSSMFSVFPSNASQGASRGSSRLPFSQREVNAVRANMTGVIAASGELRSSTTVLYADTDWTTTIRGTNEDYHIVRNYTVARGTWFSKEDVRTSKRVAVIGSTIARELFDGDNPIGSTLRLNNVAFEVIGVAAETGRSFRGQDADDVIYMPISTARARFAGTFPGIPDKVDAIYVLFDPSANIITAQTDLEEYLRDVRKIRDGQANNFRVLNFASFVAARNETTKTFGYLLAATAAIALLVGGIGIMNIMLVSVTERTREIGLRMAIGAKPHDVMVQFLIESVVLCTLGGIIGLILGLAGAFGTAHLLDTDVLINIELALIAIAASFVVGVFFGFFPARQAAKLNPIDALRYE